MASALQKLFRKRISKQQLQEQRQKQEAEAAKRSSVAPSSPRKETQPYLTVSSLNSPSSSTLHFPFSSKVSLAAYSAQPGEDGSFSASPQRQDSRLLRQDSDGSNHRARPRAASLSAASMMRDLSDSSERRRTLQYPDVDTLTDQFGTLIEGNTDRDAQGRLGGEEDELDENLLYAALTNRSSLHHDWNMAKLVLVPSKMQDIRFEDLDSDAYIALHALLPSNLFKDQYVSVRSHQSKDSTQRGEEDQWDGLTMTATLEAESQSIQLVVTRSTPPTGKVLRIEHTVTVLSETTVYRTMSSQEVSHTLQPTSATQGQKRNRRERVRIRILTIDGPVLPDDALARLRPSGSPSLSLPGGMVRSGSEQSFQTQLENRQNQQAKDAIAFPQGSPTLDKPPSPYPAQSSLSELHSNSLEASLIPSRRQFLADFAFLLDPPVEAGSLQAPLHAAFDTLVRAAKEFTSAYVYVSGFDAYNVSRIRRGILSKAWQAFETCNGDGDSSSLGAEGRARLLLLLENVVMGYCHGKIYSSIRGVYRNADEAVDNVICTYQELQVSLEDLGVNYPAICRRPALLDRAIFIAKHLGDADEDMEHLLVDCNVTLIRSLAKQGDLMSGSTEDNVFYTPERDRGRIRTPLDVFDVLQATLEEIGSALEKANKSSLEKKGTVRASLGTDELLPVLAYVMIRAGPMKLVSLLYYARQFGLSDAISSQSNWALVTHDAVIEYLRKDPLQLTSAKSPTYCSSVHSFSSQSTLFHSPITKTSTQMERKISSSEGWRRERRCSLPGSILLPSIHSELSESTLPSCTSSDLPSSASIVESAEDQSASETGFKVPGRPASAYAVNARSRVMSALDAVGEDVLAASQSSPRASPSFARPASSLSRRTTSMSGSGDLLIRPQIVVRPMKNSSRSPTTSTGSRDRVLLSDITNTHQSASKNLDRTLSLGSKKMIRTGSEEPPNRRFDQGGANAVQMPKQARRKSLDSWASFSFFGNGAGSLLSTPEGSGATSSGAEVSPSASSQGYPITPTGLASSPTMWLSSWTTDWVQKRKDSLPAALDHRMSSDAESRPGSITSSNEDSMAPFRNNSISSSSHHSSPHVRSDDSHVPERRRRPVIRSRLLSTSTPTEPLPPQVYPDTATGDYFHRQHFHHTPSSSSSHTPLDASVRLHSALTPSNDQLTPRSLDSRESLHHGFFAPPSIGKVQIPTPVEETSDPMSAAQIM